MKKLFVTLAFAGLTVGAFAQGTVLFQNTAGVGKEKYIYGVDAANPTSDVLGGTRDKVAGTTYTAELWVGTSAADLHAVAGSQVTFKTGTTAGLINGISKLAVDGFLGGTKVTLQLRAWDNQGGTVKTWADVLANGAVARGQSGLVSGYELAGVDADNGPHVGSGNLAAAGLQSFGLYVVVPEPSVIALGALGLGALVLRRRK